MPYALIGTAYLAFAEHETAILGEEPAGALVRSCADPASVTDEDLRVLASHYNQRLFVLSAMIEAEMVAFGSERWRVFAPGQLLSILTTEHGRWYWEFVKPALWPSLRTVGDEMVAALGPVDCAPFWESFRTRTPLEVEPAEAPR